MISFLVSLVLLCFVLFLVLFWFDLFLFFYVFIFYFFISLNFYFYFILLYNTVLVFPYIDMNPPRVYLRPQTWTLLPPPSPQHPSGSSPCTSPKHAVSCIGHRLVIRFLHDSIHVSMPLIFGFFMAILSTYFLGHSILLHIQPFSIMESKQLTVNQIYEILKRWVNLVIFW